MTDTGDDPDAVLASAGDALADALVAAATDESLRGRLTAAGLERSAGFRWATTVERTDAVIERLLDAA